MSGGGALQQRTTFLISLTLVKVEAVEENGGEARPGRGSGEEARAQIEKGAEAHLVKPQQAEDASLNKVEVTPADVLGTGPPRNLPAPAERNHKTKSAEIDLTRFDRTKRCTPPSVTTTPPAEAIEPSQTLTRTSLPICPAGQRPVSLLKSHSSVATRGRDSRDGRERSPTSAQSLDRKDCRVPTRSPGPCRASWAEASRPDHWRDLQDEATAGPPLEVGSGTAAMMRDVPRKERLKTGSASLPPPACQASKPARKGKSRTLDNSDLNSLSEDLGLAREAQQGQRGSAKDRKMLKFISGIFTKSSSGVVESVTAPPLYIQRDSSEEEGKRSPHIHDILAQSIPSTVEPASI